MGTFLYRCFFSFLQLPMLVVATLFNFFFSSNTILYTIFSPKSSSFLGTELIRFSLTDLLKYFVLQYYYSDLSLLCYFCQVTLLLLRPHKCYSSIIQWLFQLHTPTSHAHITALTYVPLLHRSFYMQIHNSIPAFYDLSSAFSSPSFSAMFHLSIPISCTIRYTINFFQNLPLTLSNSSHASVNIHNSIRYVTFEPHAISYTSASQPLWDRGPVNSFFLKRGPGPNNCTRKYLSIFLISYIKLT